MYLVCPLKLWVTLDFLQFIIEHKYNLKCGRPCFLSVWVVVLRKLYTCLILSQSWDPKFWSVVATQNLRSLLLPVATWIFGQLHGGRVCLLESLGGGMACLNCLLLFVPQRITSEWVLGIPCSSLSAYSSATVRYKHPAGHQCYGQEEGGSPWPFVVTVWCKRKFVYWDTSPSLLVPPSRVYLFWSSLNPPLLDHPSQALSQLGWVWGSQRSASSLGVMLYWFFIGRWIWWGQTHS